MNGLLFSFVKKIADIKIQCEQTESITAQYNNYM